MCRCAGFLKVCFSLLSNRLIKWSNSNPIRTRVTDLTLWFITLEGKPNDQVHLQPWFHEVHNMFFFPGASNQCKLWIENKWIIIFAWWSADHCRAVLLHREWILEKPREISLIKPFKWQFVPMWFFIIIFFFFLLKWSQHFRHFFYSSLCMMSVRAGHLRPAAPPSCCPVCTGQSWRVTPDQTRNGGQPAAAALFPCASPPPSRRTAGCNDDAHLMWEPKAETDA